MIELRPFILKNTVQNYAWGTKGPESYIANLLQIKDDSETPYAELWMGAHPKASSQIFFEDTWVDLNEVIDRYPIEMLGKNVSKIYENKLPFLFKVLSAGEPLSIQAHPTIEQAKKLHLENPENYPDENHKPEIAIALDHLTALVGFKPYQEIQSTIILYPGITVLIGKSTIDGFLTEVPPGIIEQKTQIKNLYATIINLSENDPEIFETIIKEIKSSIESKKVSERFQFENLYLQMFYKYGADIGLISILFFNLIHLRKGEAIFTPAGLPHAYINGNIIECMANSDNVIRAGLTPKFKDVNNLIKLMDYTPGYPELVKIEVAGSVNKYLCPVEEFVVKLISLDDDDVYTYCSGLPSIILAIEGELEIQWYTNNSLQKIELTRGSSVFIPAQINDLTLKNKIDSEIFVATVNY
ncbi:MAG: mannose-6-phosphate isomerase, class I [Ignavibacteriae bacterium HGW-Ignavibacteriae-2]|jgi:mannose-6-phosphate isomerase|nr:mannose-6-phosphate isomerase, class I [Bacteroidota bacterium]PKL87227.1 MAG: mannose-6-phosphate isomerase, class I [Ignavibacteriae bacterium HGW-Ignavibacteriae-2]